MTSYLLLRSNKESGPYNLEDLIRGGLKPYDLVWIQGKSAAWRYPSEIEELKPYAPVTEEQPYDRFYKKNTAESMQQEERDSNKPAVVPVEPLIEKTPAIEEKYSQYIPKEQSREKTPKRSVFVTLPGQPAVAPVASPAITVTENPVAAQVNYSQPLDEIKEMYVKTLQERKSKIARKNLMATNVKKAAVITGLVAIGILAGFVIKSRPGETAEAKLAGQSPLPHVSGNETPSSIPAQDEQPGSIQGDQAVREPAANEPVEKVRLSPRIKEQLLRQENRQPAQEESPVKNPPAMTPKNTFLADRQITENIEKDPVTGERSRKLRSENMAENNTGDAGEKISFGTRRNNGLADFVSVASNDYKRVAFGGIRNLELTVTNDSKYKLDKVVVELQYLKPSEELLKTEMIQFRSIAANGSSTMRIRDTNRGIKVLYKIVDIQTQQGATALSGF